ncbi:MAG TPA: sugar ABC transporter permease [Thermodesulfobacteriota bacterium]
MPAKPGAGAALLGQYRLPVLFLGPAVLLVLLVNFIPLGYALVYSVYRTEFVQRVSFLGFRYYLRFLTDPEGLNNILRTFQYVFGSLALALPLGLLIALLIHRVEKGKTFFRTLIILPWVVSQIITALTWSWLVNPQFGPVTYFVREGFGGAFNALGTPTGAMATLILANVWHSFPYPMLLILAALQTVPREAIEAALVEGASRWTRLFRIRLPLIRNTILIATVMMTIHYFNMVTLPLVLTGGGPAGATEVMAIRVYREAFQLFHVGYASAIAVYMFLFNILFSIIYIRILRGEGHA